MRPRLGIRAPSFRVQYLAPSTSRLVLNPLQWLTSSAASVLLSVGTTAIQSVTPRFAKLGGHVHRDAAYGCQRRNARTSSSSGWKNQPNTGTHTKPCTPWVIVGKYVACRQTRTVSTNLRTKFGDNRHSRYRRPLSSSFHHSEPYRRCL